MTGFHSHLPDVLLFTNKVNIERAESAAEWSAWFSAKRKVLLRMVPLIGASWP
jgi:hypothetical protein